MKISDALTPILLATLILVVMVSAALQQQSDKQTQRLLAQLTEQLGESPRVMVDATNDPPTENEPASSDTPTDNTATDSGETDPHKSITTDTTDKTDTTDTSTTDTTGVTTDASDTSGGGDANDADESEWTEFGPTVEQIIRQLLTGQYDAVYSRFNEDMRSALPVRTIADVINPLREKHGAFDSIASHSSPFDRLPAGSHAFRVTVAMKKTPDQPLVFTITLDDQKQIAGLYVR